MMRWLLDRLFGPGLPGARKDDELPPEASPRKLREAEEWTAQKEREISAIRREYARYELELQLEHGKGAQAHAQGRANANARETRRPNR